MAKTNWATASSKIAEAKEILNTLAEDNKPYTISIGTEKTPISEVITKLGDFAYALGQEVHFTNSGISVPTEPEESTSESTTESSDRLFG